MSPFDQNNNIKYTKGMVHKATSIKAKKARRSVEFIPEVGLRIVSVTANQNSFVSWYSAPEILSMKRRAKSLAKLHYRLHKNNLSCGSLASISSDSDGETSTTSDSSAISSTQTSKYIHPTRYGIKGESLRGMEYITDLADGRRRQGVRSGAISAAVGAQEQYLSSRDIARLYGNQSQVAMEYSKRVAEEDALEAAKILRSKNRSETASVSIVESHPEPILCKHHNIGSQHVKMGLCWNCWNEISPTQSVLYLLKEIITFDHAAR